MLAMFYSDMMALGFEKPRSLSLNIITVVEMFYKVASSSLKSIPRLSLKQEIFHNFQMNAKLDAFNVSRALQMTFKKILLKEDNDILFPFIFEHFPQVQVSKIEMAEKTDRNQVKKSSDNLLFVDQIASILQRADWPLLIGPVGIGKTSAVQAAAQCLKKAGQDYEVCQVSLASYSPEELFGWEQEGKRHSGILSNYLDQTSKPMLIILQAPLSENVAYRLAAMYDGSIKQPLLHRFVLEAYTSEIVPPILLARCSIISMSKEDESGLSELYPLKWQRTGKWSTDAEEMFSKLKDGIADLPMVTKNEAELRRMSRQALVLFKLMVEYNQMDNTIMANNIVSSFCWSFGVSITYSVSRQWLLIELLLIYIFK